MRSGVWCVHCEHVTLDEDIGTNEYGDRFCSICDAGDFDLWDVRGNFATGQMIATGSDELVQMRAFLYGDSDYPDDDQPWPGEGK